MLNQPATYSSHLRKRGVLSETAQRHARGERKFIIRTTVTEAWSVENRWFNAFSRWHVFTLSVIAISFARRWEVNSRNNVDVDDHV